MRRLNRRGFVVIAASILAGCGGDGATDSPDTTVAGTTTPGNPALGEVTSAGGLELSSPAFDDGGSIPERYGREAENVNPPLDIEGVPDGTESFTLIMDDPDAPGGTFLHWLVWNVPGDRRTIPEGWDAAEATEGKNDFETTGYGGPDPPDGEEHRYRFKLYALDTTLSLSASASRAEVGDAMRGHVLGRSGLNGTYTVG
ncbi:MAG: YbhB/YbcL family Raf kinase inhibitor-like protein [Halobacteriales archaeon]